MSDRSQLTWEELESIIQRGPTWLDLQRVVDLETAARLRGVSPDTLGRHFQSQILTLSPRRRGMRLRDALMLSA
jgi:hypothetical protein